MKLTQLQEKAAKLQNAEVLGPPPEFVIPDGAGVPGCHRMIILVPVTQKDGQAVGVSVDTNKNRMHRLEVVRVMAYDGCTQDEIDLLCTRVPKDSRGYHDDNRPDRRLSMPMWRSAPRGMRNEKPWHQAYAAVASAANWICAKVQTVQGAEQWALLMVVDVTDFVERKPDNPRFNVFDEATITGVLALEVVKLSDVTVELLPEPEAEADEDASDIEEED